MSAAKPQRSEATTPRPLARGKELDALLREQNGLSPIWRSDRRKRLPRSEADVAVRIKRLVTRARKQQRPLDVGDLRSLAAYILAGERVRLGSREARVADAVNDTPTRGDAHGG